MQGLLPWADECRDPTLFGRRLRDHLEGATQSQTALSLMREKWTCSEEMYGWQIRNHRDVIYGLRARGHRIVSRECENPHHDHPARQRFLEWKLRGGEGSL
jgi:hypothetical protein